MSQATSAPQRLGFPTLLATALLIALVATAFWGGQRLRRLSASGPDPITSLAAIDTADQKHARAELLYQSLCASCHGRRGRGDGPAWVGRPPRPFAQTDWRSATSAASIGRVIADGNADAAMPGFRQAISPTDIELLADHILRLADNKSPEAAEPSLTQQIEAAGFDAVPPRPAPAISVQSTAGRQVTLDELRGSMVLLHFWGTSCVHCLQEFTSLGDLEADGAIEILSICIDQGDPPAVESAGRRFAGEHPLYVDPSGLSANRYQVQAMPAYFLIDRNGQVIATRTGSGPWSAAALRALASMNRPTTTAGDPVAEPNG